MKVVEHNKIEKPLDQRLSFYNPKEDTLHILDKESLYFYLFEEARLKAERKNHLSMKILLSFENSTSSMLITMGLLISTIIGLRFIGWPSYIFLGGFGVLIAIFVYETQIIEKQLKQSMMGR